MKTRIGLGFVGALLLGCGCGGPPAGTTKATVSDASAATEGVAAPETTEPVAAAAPTETRSYTLSEESEIGFTGYKIVGQHSGSFLLFDGTISVPDGDIEKAGMEATFETMSVLTDDDTLTQVMKGKDFFDVNNYPEILFSSTSVKKGEDGYMVTGTLEMRDVAKTIAFPAKIAIDGDTLNLDASFTVDRTAWGIVYDGVADNVLKKDVLLTLNIQAEADD